MFGFNKNKPQGQKLTLHIDGMHCTSCSLNIDGELEDLAGVLEASTNYAKSTSSIIYNPTKISVDKITKTVTDLGYKASLKQ